MWHYTGFARIHFNKKDEAPLYASITAKDHSWEVLAKELHIDGAVLTSGFDLGARPGLDPIWWLEGEVLITLDSAGTAIVSRPPQT